jgi:uncharacterized protein (DUF2267 family)
MKYERFVGQVQDRARLDSRGAAVQAIRATLETLRQRLQKGEADDLAAQLPEEVGVYLKSEAPPERFELKEFFHRVAQAEQADEPEAAHHARAVASVLKEAVSGGEMADLRAQLPPEFAPLFEFGSEGALGG